MSIFIYHLDNGHLQSPQELEPVPLTEVGTQQPTINPEQHGRVLTAGEETIVYSVSGGLFALGMLGAMAWHFIGQRQHRKQQEQASQQASLQVVEDR